MPALQHSAATLRVAVCVSAAIAAPLAVGNGKLHQNACAATQLAHKCCTEVGSICAGGGSDHTDCALMPCDYAPSGGQVCSRCE